MSQIIQYFDAGTLGVIATITGNSGGPIPPDGAGNINLIGTSPLSFAGAGNTLTGSIAAATTLASGIIELATSAEAIAGVDTTRAVVPSGLEAKLGPLTNHGLMVAQGPGVALTALGNATNGQLPIGSTGADPVLATLTAGAGISITNAAGSITIANTGAGFTWTNVTGASQALVKDNAYIADRGTLVTFTLPLVAALGDTFQVVGKGAGFFAIAQNAGQSVHLVSATTTIGVGGSLTSIEQYDAIEIVCTVANTEFTVVDVTGNFTVV